MKTLKAINLITNRLNKLVISKDITRYGITTTTFLFKNETITNITFELIVWDIENQKEVEYLDDLNIPSSATKKKLLKNLEMVLSEYLGELD